MKVAPVSGDLLVKVAIGGGVLLLVAMALRRATDGISNAASSVWNPITSYVDGVRQTVGQAAGAITDGARDLVDYTGGASYTNPAAYTVPTGYESPWWMGGAVFPVKPPEQADVRRIDNAIDATDYSGYGPYVNESGMDFRYF